MKSSTDATRSHSRCEACESSPATITEACGEGDVYWVCAACHRRLVARELRPLEWYNLAKRHGGWPMILMPRKRPGLNLAESPTV
jgi:hypothetical protein